jgi:alpha-ketoglutarate-dependent taurine dioxygenase
MDFTLLKKNGWMLIDGISSSSDLIELAQEIGSIIRAPNNEIVKQIRQIPKEKALPESQSSIYGTGPFPLHTDTVFWPLPVRYVLFRAYGDIRRPTTVKSFSELLQKCNKHFHSLCERSIWYVGPQSNRFCCTLKFREDNAIGWRYDPDLMTPVNRAAYEVNKLLKMLVFDKEPYCINWTGNNAVILSNWDVLHGRGPQPFNEGERIIERIYVR